MELRVSPQYLNTLIIPSPAIQEERYLVKSDWREVLDSLCYPVIWSVKHQDSWSLFIAEDLTEQKASGLELTLVPRAACQTRGPEQEVISVRQVRAS